MENPDSLDRYDIIIGWLLNSNSEKMESDSKLLMMGKYGQLLREKQYETVLKNGGCCGKK